MSCQAGLPGLVAGVVVPRKERYNFPVYETTPSQFDNEQIKINDLDEYVKNKTPRTQKDREKDFLEYLERTSKLSFNILGEDFDIIVPYKHRWAKPYRKGFVRKMYQLETMLRRRGLKCGMITLTSAQTGFEDIEVLKRFKVSWSKFSDNLRIMGFLYFVIYEPHESGMPHMHVLIVGGLTEKEQTNVDAGISLSSDIMDAKIKRLEHLWHEHYDMGAEGIDFDYSAGWREGIESITNYMMKYLSKTVISDFKNDPGLLRFHSLFWDLGVRMFSCSRYLSRVMCKIRVVAIVIDKITVDYRVLYDRETSCAFPCKYQQFSRDKLKKMVDHANSLAGHIEKINYADIEYNHKVFNKFVRCKYKLLPFEIKSKIERNLPFVPFDNNEQRDNKNGQLKFISLNNSFKNFASWINNMELINIIYSDIIYTSVLE